MSAKIIQKKHWTRSDEEKRICEQWLVEPLINPETGCSIDRNGPTFKKYKDRCKKLCLKGTPVATKEMTLRKCQEWKRHPNINPDTGRKIAKDGPTWKWLEKQCKCVEDSQTNQIELLGEYNIPDSKGMTPCVKYRESWYVVRKYQDRQVWGSLNKPARQIQLYYYTDTWDYRNNHYRPIFMDGAPPRPKIQRKITARDIDWLTVERPKDNSKYVVDNVIDLFMPLG